MAQILGSVVYRKRLWSSREKATMKFCLVGPLLCMTLGLEFKSPDYSWLRNPQSLLKCKAAVCLYSSNDNQNNLIRNNYIILWTNLAGKKSQPVARGIFFSKWKSSLCEHGRKASFWNYENIFERIIWRALQFISPMNRENIWLMLSGFDANASWRQSFASNAYPRKW